MASRLIYSLSSSLQNLFSPRPSQSAEVNRTINPRPSQGLSNNAENNRNEENVIPLSDINRLNDPVFQAAVEFQTNTAGLSSHTDRHVPQFHKIMENSHVPQSQTLNKISSTSPGDFAPTQGEIHVT